MINLHLAQSKGWRKTHQKLVVMMNIVMKETLIKTGDYKIEVIDTWEMTTTEQEETFSGKVNVKLPGKKYMLSDF